MRSVEAAANRFLLIGVLAVTWLLLAGCSLMAGPAGSATPMVYPHKDAPVTVTVDGEMLVIANNTPNSIYHLVFPTEILPVIEWAPCIAPEVCPPEQRIDPGDEKQIALRTIIGDDTESTTVFWWHFLEKRPGASVPPMELNEIHVPMP